MNINVFNGLPKYVRITVLSQIRRLLSSGLFNCDDTEDLTQEILLFYLKRFYHDPDPDEALVVHSLRQYTSNLISQRYHRRDFLYSSLTDFETVDGEFSFLNGENSSTEDKVLAAELENFADDKEKQILRLIKEGYSVNEITARMRIHKRVVRRLFEKLRKM